MNFPDPTALLADFASAFGQTQRLLQLQFGPGSGLSSGQLLPFKLSGHHSINHGYGFELVCLSSDAFIPLKELIGQAIAVTLLCDDGAYRPITGWVGAVQDLGSNGGFASYSLGIEDPLTLLERRFNNRVFQEVSAKDACLTILREHLAANAMLAASMEIDDRCTHDYPVQSWITQYNESDAHFIRRLLAQEGINHVYAHRVDQDYLVTTLILFDENAKLDAIGAVRFHRADGTEESDSVTSWQAKRKLAPGAVSAASFDYKPVSVARVSETSRLDQGKGGEALSASLEDYRHDVSHYGNDANDYQRYAHLRRAAHEQAAKSFTGESSARAFLAGARFSLTQHPELDAHAELDRHFVLTRVELNAVNNLPGLDGDSETNTRASQERAYRNTFIAQRDTVRLVPEYRHTEHAKPAAPQLLSATVVGPSQEEIYTDELGRIKVNLHFPRAQDHAQGGAAQNETDSVWLRVAQAWSGAEYGALFIPRVGDEVLIAFVGGDLDRPVVISTLYNGSHHPPTFSHTGALPGNKTLSGIKSKMHKGLGANELILDDTTQQLRTRLATDHGHTALNQGYLVHPRSEGRGRPRGEGFELRTDLAGALRAAKGLLITTDARPQAQDTHLARQELLGLSQTLLSIAQELAALSDTHHAETTDTQAQTQLLQDLKDWEQGSNTAAADGASPNSNSLGKPIIALSAPAGIMLGSAKAINLNAASNLDIVAGQDANLSLGRKLKIRAREALSLFAHSLGMKLIAAGGKIEIQAHGDNIEITANKKIILSALEGIEFHAPQVSTIAEGAGMNIGGNQITSKTTGTHVQYAGQHQMQGPAAVNFTPPGMPRSELKTDEQVYFYDPQTGEAVTQRPYDLRLADGQRAGGESGTEGHSEFVKSQAIAGLDISVQPKKDAP